MITSGKKRKRIRVAVGEAWQGEIRIKEHQPPWLTLALAVVSAMRHVLLALVGVLERLACAAIAMMESIHRLKVVALLGAPLVLLVIEFLRWLASG